MEAKGEARQDQKGDTQERRRAATEEGGLLPRQSHTAFIEKAGTHEG